MSNRIDLGEDQIFRTEEDASKLVEILTEGEDGDDRPWTYLVRPSGSGSIIGVYDEEGEFVSNWKEMGWDIHRGSLPALERRSSRKDAERRIRMLAVVTLENRYGGEK